MGFNVFSAKYKTMKLGYIEDLMQSFFEIRLLLIGLITAVYNVK